MNFRKAVTVAVLMALFVTTTWLPFTAQAVPRTLSEPTALARYFPANVLFYGNIRMDDDYVEELDGLLSKLPIPLPITSLRGLLIENFQQANISYQEDIRSWLGERLAFGFGVPNARGQISDMMFAVDMIDATKAVVFFDKLIAAGRLAPTFVKRAAGNQTIYESTSIDQQIVIGDGVVLAGTVAAITASLEAVDKLDKLPAFADSYAQMVSGNYNLLGFFNLAPVLPLFQQMMSGAGGNAAQQAGLLLALYEAVGPMMIGGTIADDALILDIVQQVRVEKLGEAGYILPAYSPLIDTFRTHIPQDASLVIHGANFNALYEAALNALQVTLRAQGQPAEMWDRGMQQIESLVKGLTGLDLKADILSWMTGDYALFISYMPPGEDAPTLFYPLFAEAFKAPFSGLEFGIVMQVTDKAKAGAFVAGLGAAAKRLLVNIPSLKIGDAQVGGAAATTFSFVTPEFSSPIELALAANDSVVVLATMNAAASVLSGGSGLDQSAGFIGSLRYMIDTPTPTAIWFMDTNGTVLLADLLALQQGLAPRTQRIFRDMVDSLNRTPTAVPNLAAEAAQAVNLYQFAQRAYRQFAGLVEHATISTTSVENDYTIMRATIKLGSQ